MCLKVASELDKQNRVLDSGGALASPLFSSLLTGLYIIKIEQEVFDHETVGNLL